MNIEQEKSNSLDKIQSLRRHIEEFSGYTTFHGAHFVIGTDRGIFRRIFWLLLILTGLGFLTKQLVESYNKLQAKEHVITKEMLSVEENGLKFPAVTICNANMMKKDEIKGTDAEIYIDQLNPFKNFFPFPNWINNRTLNSSFDIKEAVLRYGHKASDMVMMCLWDRQFCSPLNFTTRFSQLYGLCHTFNSGQDGHHLMYSTSIKRSRGLQMLLLIEKDKYYGIMSYINTGIRMTVHDQDEEPMVEVNGVDVMPGHMTTIKIQREEYISLPPPFKSACGSRTLKTSKIYSRSKCVMECTTRKVIRQCGCRLLGLPDLPEYNGSKHCTPKEMFSCGIFDYPSSSEVKVSFLNALFKYFLTSDSTYSTDNPGRECDCPKTCTQIQHKIAQINVISLMSESFLRETFPFRETPNKDQEIRNLMTSFRDNLALLAIQYDDLYTHRTSEREAYGIDDFGSDVGGYLGLFLGCSVLTFFEIFDFIISYLLGKQKPMNQVEQSDCKIENQVTGSINSAIDRSEGNEVLPSN